MDSANKTEFKKSRITTVLTQLIPHGGNNCEMKTFNLFDSLMIPRLDVKHFQTNKCYQFLVLHTYKKNIDENSPETN